MTRLGFEPKRVEHIGLAVQHLNHSVTSSAVNLQINAAILKHVFEPYVQSVVTVSLHLMKSVFGNLQKIVKEVVVSMFIEKQNRTIHGLVSFFSQREVTDEVAEWLRRWTANPMCSARVGSNPILVVSINNVFSESTAHAKRFAGMVNILFSLLFV